MPTAALPIGVAGELGRGRIEHLISEYSPDRHPGDYILE